MPDLDGRHIDIAARILALMPLAHALLVQPDRQRARPCEVHGIGVEFDLDLVWSMPIRFIEEDVPTRHKEQLRVSFEEEAARARQQAFAIERGDPGRSEQY